MLRADVSVRVCSMCFSSTYHSLYGYLSL